MKRLTYRFKVFLLLLAALLAVSGIAQAGSNPNFNISAGMTIAPEVTAISPSTAQNTAPVTAIITGGYFYTGANTAGVTALRLTKTSGTPATINISAYSVVSETQIVNAIIPQGYPVGSYDVRATTMYGENSTSAMQFVFSTPAPVVSSLSVSTGSNLAPVTISVNGTGFFGGIGANTVTSVKLGTLTLTAGAATSDSTIPGVIIPSGVYPGTYDVTVVALGGTSVTSASDKFTVTTPVPTVSSLSVSTGSNLAPVTIIVSGTGFFGGMTTNTVTAVKLGTLSVSYNALSSDSAITKVIIPSGVYPGTYDVTVVALGGTSVTSASDKFTVTTPAPTVSSLSVSTGSNLAPVTISVNGTGFFGGIGANTVTSVKLGTLTLTAGAATSDSTIPGVVIPSGLALGTYDITVAALGGTSGVVAGDKYTVTTSAPVVSSLSSSTGSNLNAATITVTGSGFFGGVGSSTVSAVKLGTISIGSYLTASDNIVGFVVPAGTMIGTYDVTVTALGGTSSTSSADVYIVTTPAPVVSSLSVSTGSNLAPVTISVNGTGFFGGIGVNTVTSVKLGTLTLTAGAATSDSAIPGVVIPSGLALGTYDITVAALGGTSITAAGDKYIVTTPAPAVTALSLASASNAAPVTITVSGTGFFGGVGSNTVTSVKLGTLTLTAGAATSDSTIPEVIIPSGITAGTYDITVAALGGTSLTVSGDKFTVILAGPPVPVVSSLSVNTGSNLAPVTISVNGSGFFGGAGSNTVTAVKLGTITLTAGAATSDSAIPGVIIPSGLALGTYDVKVTALGGTSATAAGDKFVVTTPLPVVSSLSVSTGSNLAPVTISVSGSGFFGGVGSSTVSSVKLGTLSIAAGYTATNDSTITGVVIPSGLALGTYDITVTALGGTSATVAGDRFTVTTPAPAVSGLSQTTGSNTLPVTITVSGSGFFGGVGTSTVSSVKLGTLALTYTAASGDGTITGVIIPAALLPGTYNVIVAALGGTSATVAADRYIVTATVPVVSSLSVTTGSNLAAVTLNIAGAGFFGGVGSNTVTSVKLGATVLAAGYSVADTSITGVIIPAGMPVGTYDITVTTFGGTSAVVAGDKFAVTTPAPVVSSISASTGVNTAPVTISLTGSGFFGGLASSTVSSVKLGIYTLSGYNVASDSSITGIIIPAGTNSGTYDITVTAAGGVSATSSADKYTVPPTPFVSNISPDNIGYGYTASVTLTITGTGFFAGTGSSNVTAIRLDNTNSTALTGWSVSGDTQITGAVVPVGLQPGTYNVLVATTLGGVNGYSAVRFKVVGPSIVLSTAGSVLTGKTITITANITVGGVAAVYGSSVTCSITKPDLTVITKTGTVDLSGNISFPLLVSDLNQLGDYRYTVSYGGVSVSSDFMVADLPKSGDVAIGGKVFTPGQGAFNKAVFTYTANTPVVDVAELTILSLRGRLIRKMSFAPGVTIAWDGLDSNGNVCDAGIVLWRLRSGGKVSGGTLVVAK